MRLEIRTKDVATTGEERVAMERRVRFALGRFEQRLGRVEVRLSDLNGPRGGLDKRCRIVLRVIPAGLVVVEDEDADAVAAVHRAADRASRAVARALERRRDGAASPSSLGVRRDPWEPRA